MSTSFKVGDIVQLASGGPKMTVEQVGLKVHVVWFVFQGEPSMTWSGPYRDQFDPVLLKAHVPYKGKKPKGE